MSTKVLIWLLYTTLSIYVSSGYHLSLSILEWYNASQYCESYCNSHLASIHSEQDYLSALDVINHNPYVYKRVWIGLNDIQHSDIWQWSDGSPFNFGNNYDSSGYIVYGSYPWRVDEPDRFDDEDQCVAYDVGSDYASITNQWIDREWWKDYHFLCNSCSSKLHKYVITWNGWLNYSEAGKECEDRFGTSLASIHSDRDMFEAMNICEAESTSTGCWIGLNDMETRRDYKWDDGTQWDYGTIFNEFPWYYTQPGSVLYDDFCVFIDPYPENYLWDDIWCNYTAYTLCNAPSEICMNSQWFIAKGLETDWIWSKNSCEVTYNLLNNESIAIIDGKQYLNIDGVLMIDMMYTMNADGGNGKAGIVMYFDENNCDNYYYIAVQKDPSIIFITKCVDGVKTLINSTYIAYNLGTYYLLSIELINGILWNIQLNDKPMLQSVDNAFDNAGNTLSGYIGIRSVNAALSVKSLFISGDVVYFDSNSWYRSCTDSPTLYPTKSPTLYSTSNPSQSPTTTSLPTISTTKLSMQSTKVRYNGSMMTSQNNDISKPIERGESDNTAFIILAVMGLIILCCILIFCVLIYLKMNKDDKECKDVGLERIKSISSVKSVSYQINTHLVSKKNIQQREDKQSNILPQYIDDNDDETQDTEMNENESNDINEGDNTIIEKEGDVTGYTDNVITPPGDTQNVMNAYNITSVQSGSVGPMNDDEDHNAHKTAGAMEKD